MIICLSKLNTSSMKKKESVVFARDSKNVNRPLHLKNYVFLLYAPRNINIGPMQYERQDADVLVS